MDVHDYAPLMEDENSDDFEMHCLACDHVSPPGDECPVCGSDDLDFHQV